MKEAGAGSNSSNDQDNCPEGLDFESLRVQFEETAEDDAAFVDGIPDM